MVINWLVLIFGHINSCKFQCTYASIYRYNKHIKKSLKYKII